MKYNERIANLPVYEAGKPVELVAREFGVASEDIVKLASNENPFGSSPLVVEAIKKCAQRASVYPDDSFYELKDALAFKFEMKQENFIIGSGSDQVIEFAIQALVNDKTAILHAGVTFAMYGIYASHAGAKVYRTKSATHDLEELSALYEEHKDEIKIIFLCLPNNPLGECLDASEVEKFIASVDSDTLVALDCAYMDFARFKDPAKAINPKQIIEKYPNVLYMGTFSKAYGLGGMRVGYGIANSEMIAQLHKLRAPFNITTPSLAAAIAALKDEDFVRRTLENNFSQMKLYEDFANANNIKFIPSYTNFITFFFDASRDSSAICDALLRRGVILRNLRSYGLNAIRITIGRPEQNARVLAELSKEL